MLQFSCRFAFFINFSLFKVHTENNANFENYTSHCLSGVNMAAFSKEDKILIKSLYECKGYNARQFITEFPDKGWTKNSIKRLLVKLRKFRTVLRVIFVTSGDALRTNIKQLKLHYQ